MRYIKCPYCGEKSSKYGRTGAGTQRWKCGNCNNTFTEKVDSSAKLLTQFLRWLFSKEVQADMPGKGRTFRRKTAKFWSIWPLPPKIEEQYDVLYLDGIYLSRKLCVLICCSDEHVLGWYVCRYENSRGWKALMERIVAPRVVISDGGYGFAKALRESWPHTNHQRCIFHAFTQVKRYTTGRPKTVAGRELYELSKRLFSINNLGQAAAWIEELESWRMRHDAFLREMTMDEFGNQRSTHERLLKAEKSLIRLIKRETLFTYLEFIDIAVSPYNNRLEGGVNAQLRAMLINHRGLSLERRLKAVYWWCYMHSPRPLSASNILRCMPTDASIAKAYQVADRRYRVDRSIPHWGDAIVWNELHMSTEFPTYWD